VDPSSTQNPYTTFSTVHEQVFGSTIGETFINGITSFLSVNENYPFCTPVAITVDETEYLYNQTVAPMSAACYQFIPTDQSYYDTIEITANTSGDQELSLIVHDTALPFSAGASRQLTRIYYAPLTVWVANTQMTPYQETNTSPFNLSMKITSEEVEYPEGEYRCMDLYQVESCIDFGDPPPLCSRTIIRSFTQEQEEYTVQFGHCSTLGGHTSASLCDAPGAMSWEQFDEWCPSLTEWLADMSDVNDMTEEEWEELVAESPTSERILNVSNDCLENVTQHCSDQLRSVYLEDDPVLRYYYYDGERYYE